MADLNYLNLPDGSRQANWPDWQADSGGQSNWMWDMAQRRAALQDQRAAWEFNRAKREDQQAQVDAYKARKLADQMSQLKLRDERARVDAMTRPAQLIQDDPHFGQIKSSYSMPRTMNGYMRQLYVPQNTQLAESQGDVLRTQQGLRGDEARRLYNSLAGRNDRGSVVPGYYEERGAR